MIEVIIVPFAELYTSILTDQTTGTNSYDTFVMSPQWNANFVAAGVLEDLTKRVANDTAIEWDDIAPARAIPDVPAGSRANPR